MKNRKLFTLGLVAVLAFAMVLSGCASGKPAATVGDREVTVTELENYYNNNAAYASYYGFPLNTAEEVEAFQDYLLDSMIASEMVAYQARNAGIVLTDEEKAQAQATADEAYDSTVQSFVDAANESGSADVEAYAQKLFTDALVQNGTTVNKLKKDMLSDAEDELLVTKHREALVADAGLSAEELKARFDEEQASQEALFTESPAMYFTYETNAQYGYSAMPLYVPEGLFYAKHILVEDEATANEVMDKLNAGEDFETLLAEYGTDPGMEGNELGYVVGEGANFVEPFLNGAMALEKEGDVSQPVESDYGFHIIKRLADLPAGAMAYEDVQETFDNYIQTAVQDEYYNGVVEGWLEDATLVTRYPENYRYIGKAAMALLTPTPEATAEPAATPEPEPDQGAEATVAPDGVDAGDEEEAAG